jgi:hypothetical protein
MDAAQRNQGYRSNRMVRLRWSKENLDYAFASSRLQKLKNNRILLTDC